MRYLFSIIFIVLCSTSFCQNATEIDYEIRWKHSGYVGQSRFIFNDSFSYHYFITGNDPLQFENVFSKSVQHHSTFCDKKRDLVYNGVNYPIGNTYLKREEITQLEWTLFLDTKVILGHTCFKASTKYNSGKITVWYAKDLRDGVGFPNYAGVPGTILEINDKKRNQSYRAKKIKHGSYYFVLPSAKITERYL